MKIGLIDVDGHGFPNIPLMKLSAWHKTQGDNVDWYDPMFSGHLDRVYMSKVFSFTPDFEYPVNADEVVGGVPGMQSAHTEAEKNIARVPIKTSRTTSSILFRTTLFIPI